MKKIIYCLLVLLFLVTACQPALTENQMQTAVSEAILTSAASMPVQDESSPEIIALLEEDLENANSALTQQAEKIENLEQQLETKEFIPSSTVAISTATSTPLPTATYGLPDNVKIVVAKRDAPLWHYNDKNDAGRPIMIKTSPVIRIEEGAWVIVFITNVRADGGSYYYQIQGPTNQGYFIEVDAVRDQ